jgi:hypothetical protein
MISSRISPSRAAAFLLALIAFAAFLPGTSRAVTISTTYTVTSFTIDGFQDTDFLHDLSVNAEKFNPALGTLDSIGVFWTVTLQATASQTSGTPGDGFGGGGGGAPNFNGQSSVGFSLDVNGTTTQLNKPVTVSDTEESPATTFSISAGNIFPPDFQGAIGTGTVPVFYPYGGVLDGADTLSDVSETLSGSVKVAYNYTPAGAAAAVPLPKSLSMSLVGVGTLVLLRLVKKAKEYSASSRLG